MVDDTVTEEEILYQSYDGIEESRKGTNRRFWRWQNNRSASMAA